MSIFNDSVPGYGDDGVARGRLTARLTFKNWSRCGQLPDNRTITRRERVITSAATLISRVRQVQAKPPPSGSRSRRLLKNFLRAGSSNASVGNSAGWPSSADVGADLDDRVAQPHQQVQRGRVQVEPEEVRQEPVVAEPAGVQFDLQFLVPVLALAAHRVLVVDRRRQDPAAGPVRDHGPSVGPFGIGLHLDDDGLRLRTSSSPDNRPTGTIVWVSPVFLYSSRASFIRSSLRARSRAFTPIPKV